MPYYTIMTEVSTLIPGLAGSRRVSQVVTGSRRISEQVESSRSRSRVLAVDREVSKVLVGVREVSEVVEGYQGGVKTCHPYKTPLLKQWRILL